MKKIIAILLTVTLATAMFVGCALAAAPGSVEINFAIHTAEGTNEWHTILRFQEAVQKGSNGVIAVHLFPGAALGSEMENLSQVSTGEVQMSKFGDLLTSQLTPELNPAVVPFIFPNIEEVYKTWNGPLGNMIREALEERGNHKLVALQARGARLLTSNRPITRPEEVQGIKLRVPEIASWITIWRGLGALPTPVAWPETYSALQTGVVDGQENPIENIFVGSIYEVNKYVMMTEHLYNVFHWTMNKDFFESLSPEHQALILDSAAEATAWGDRQLAGREAEIRKRLEDEGVTFVDVDRQAFINAARPFVDQVAQGWHQAAIDDIQRFYD